jgi:hypothetical protein
MIIFIAAIVHQALRNITSSCAAMVYRWKISIDCIYGFQIQSPTDIQIMVVWILAKDRFTCPTNICKVSSKFPSCLIFVLTINMKVEASICRD